MKTLICSNIFGDFDIVNDLTYPINKAYADKCNCDYILDRQKRCGSEVTSFWWEKIAFLRSIISTRGEGDLIVWLDVDSLIQDDVNIEEILGKSKDFGMVPIYAGKNGSERQNWYNAGVMALKNTEAVRSLFDAVWGRRMIDKDDETAIAIELPNSDVSFVELNPKWNCWNNNKHLVSNPAIKTFHGIYPTSEKVKAIKEVLGLNSKFIIK